MKTVQMAKIVAMLENGCSGEVIIQSMIDEQVAKGLHALHESLMDEFSKAYGQWSASEREAWRTTDEARRIEGKLRTSMKTHTRGF